jgi:hypothetical protein
VGSSDDTTRQGDPGAGMNVSFMHQSRFDLVLAQMPFLPIYRRSTDSRKTSESR